MKRYISIALAIILVLSVGVVTGSYSLAGEKKKSEWSMFRRDAEHTVIQDGGYSSFLAKYNQRQGVCRIIRSPYVLS